MFKQNGEHAETDTPVHATSCGEHTETNNIVQVLSCKKFGAIIH
jgi:hypothetical protein